MKQGFIVGCISGTCRFYEVNDESLLSVNTQIYLHSKNKSSSSRITGIQVLLLKTLDSTYFSTLLLVVFLTQGCFLQFFENDSQRVMITSEDSKIHNLDRVEVVQKYKGIQLP